MQSQTPMSANDGIQLTVTPFLKSILQSVGQGGGVVSEHKKNAMSVSFVDTEEQQGKSRRKKMSLEKSITNMLNGPDSSIERLAFEADPSQNNQYAGLYKAKVRLLPDSVIKRLMIQDDLVAAIMNARSNQIATYGRKQADRFKMGFAIEPNDGFMDDLDEKQTDDLRGRIERATKLFQSCGHISGWKQKDKLTLSQYFGMSTKHACGLGRIATEVVWVVDVQTGERKFHSFRPTDAGTIYRATPQKEAAQSLREAALSLLEKVANKNLDPELNINGEYSWVQVIDGRPVQAFTDSEMLVHNFYPVADIEMDGYPVTPLDTVLSAVTTHINITSHNKLYFQSGRAARGMLVINSEDVDETVIARIRQQFNASINSVNNAWRMPVFGVGAEDKISWQPIDSGSRDMEFQYLSDTNARVILSAFQMSPEELPGYAHLSRGTNNQALSEGNNEYLLIAHRDVGLRPLMAQWEDFINERLFPLIDSVLAKCCTFKMKGLDAETAEKESIRLQQDAPLHMSYDDILDKVDKDSIGREMGGEFPFNPQYQTTLDKYFTVGQIKAKFFGDEKAEKDPQWAYVRDPFWFQHQQMMQQEKQMEQQTQMQQQQAAQGGPPGGGGGGESSGGQEASGASGGGEEGSAGANEQSADAENQQAAQLAGQELGNAADSASAALGKSEKQLSPSQKTLLHHQQAIVNHYMAGWEQHSRDAIKAIVDVAIPHVVSGTGKKKR